MKQSLLQQQQLSANQLLSLKILAMDSSELEKFIYEEYTENPLLELSQPASHIKQLGDYFNKTDYYIHDGIIYDEPKDIGMPADCSLSDYLLAQLTGLQKFSSAQWNIFKFIISTLDERGFISLPLSEISLRLHVPLSEITACCDILQSLDPPGVCASSVNEALVLQLRRRGIFDKKLERLLRFYLAELAQGQYNKISKELKISRQALRSYIEIIKTLHPNPCRQFGNFSRQYIVPDIILRPGEDGWSVTINDTWSGSLGISKLYRQYSAAAAEETLSYLERKINRAKLVLSCIESRRKTLTRIMTYIVQTQGKFLLNQGSLCGVSIKEAASDLSIHPSTISRALTNKYIQTPRGIFSGKYFFQKSRGEQKAATVSLQEIKDILVEIIAQESKTNPYTDEELRRLFAEKGIFLSRRSIASYRRECLIKSSYERKSFR